MRKMTATNTGPTRVLASLLYVGPRPLADDAMADRVTMLLKRLSLPVERRLTDGNSGVSLRTAGPEIVIHATDAPLAASAIARLRRPDGTDRRLGRRRLEQHVAHLTLRLADVPGQTRLVLSPAQRAALAQRLVRHLMQTDPADLVVWHADDTLYTPDEFRRYLVPGIAPRNAKVLPPITDDGPEHFDRLDIRLSNAIANALPDLPNRVSDGNEALRAIFAAVSTSAPREKLARIDLVEPDEDDSLAGKLSIYVLNGTIMVMNFPIGMGLLTYNILRGGDMKVTARAMALTGAALGLMTALPAGLFSAS
jgi:hypothetical protein